ncbi:hypothetical protein CQW23_33494 [Capsicum baccatum]|uniref:Uncharacterized protein n=1 Tax=Capsicum baccatum TaxID=33114 RepID=A0A2G2V1L4_CAPBA|nr:hypothetical protein CQW23_33494 [Capsicum baccatum]
MPQLEVFVTVECNAGDASNDERRLTYSGLPWWCLCQVGYPCTVAPRQLGTVAPRHRGVMAPSHQGTKAPWHQGTVAPRHRGTMVPWHQGGAAPWYRGTQAPWHHGTVSPWHTRTVASWHQGTYAPWRHGTKARRHRGTMAPWHQGGAVPWHHGTQAPWRHGTKAPWRHGAMAPWHPRRHGAMEPRHQGTKAPRHHGTKAPWRQGTAAPWRQGTAAPWRQGTAAPWRHGTKAPRRHGAMAPRHRGAMAPWHRGTMAPRHRGTMAPRHRGTMAPRHRGTMAPWHRGTAAKSKERKPTFDHPNIFPTFIHPPRRCILIFLHIRYFGRGGAFVRAASTGCCSRGKLQGLHACGRGQSAAPVHEPQRAFISSAPPTGGLSYQAGLASALQRPHGQQRTASIAGRWGRCRACIDGAFGRTTRELCSARAVRHYQVLSIAFLPSRFVRGANRKAALASHDSLASSCDVVVRERQSGFLDAADAVGMGPSSAPICPVRRSLQTTVALTLNPSAPPRAGRAHATLVSLKECSVSLWTVCLNMNSHIKNTVNLSSQATPIATIENDLQNWSIPEESFNTIYQIGKFSFLKKHNIKTSESTVAINNSLEIIQLFNELDINRFKHQFNYLHVGLVQVAIKPLFRQGLDIPVCAILRDARLLNFDDSLLGVIQSNLADGPVYFNCYPNFSVDINDPNIMDVLTLNVKTKNMNSKENTREIAIIYRVYYRLMGTTLAPKGRFTSPKGVTTLMEANKYRSTVFVPKALVWDDILRSNDWHFENITQPIRIYSEKS